jgi:hypothetical protein
LTMARCSNWPLKLALFVEEKRGSPFSWGNNDCALFTADWLILLTGIDCGASLRGGYNDGLGAARVLKRRGGLENLIERIMKQHGWEEIPVTLARRGDVALLDVPESGQSMPSAVGVVVGRMVAMAGPYGANFAELKACRRAWRID